MLSFMPYRWFRCVFGARSFRKDSFTRTHNTYVLIRGSEINKIVDSLLNDGYVEEWPKGY